MRLFKTLAVLAVVSLFSIVAMPAMAQSVGVDIKPTVQLLLPFLVSFFGAIITGLLGIFVHGSIETRLRNAVHTALEAAASYASMKIDNADWGDIKIKNKLIALAVNYMQASVPKALAFFKITPERLEAMVLARLAYFAPPKA